MAYDGTTPLNKAVADLIGCSPKNNNKLAKVIGQAKNDLGIASKAKKLPTEINQQIYSHLVEIYSQSINNKPVEIYSHTANKEPVEIISQANEPENTPQALVELYSQDSKPKPAQQKTKNPNQSTVEIISQLNNFDNVRIAFYIMRNNKRERQVIALDGFLINALASIGISKQDAHQWVQAQVDDWTAFDSQLPITRQVKYLIIREVVKGLGGNDSVFYS